MSIQEAVIQLGMQIATDPKVQAKALAVGSKVLAKGTLGAKLALGTTTVALFGPLGGILLAGLAAGAVSALCTGKDPETGRVYDTDPENPASLPYWV